MTNYFLFPNDENITKKSLLLHFFLIFQVEVEDKNKKGVEMRDVFIFFHLSLGISQHLGEGHEPSAGLCGTHTQ